MKVKDIEIGGAILTKNGVKAGSIVIGDRGRVRGPLFGCQGGHPECKHSVRIGEKADVEAVYGKTVTLEEKSRATLVHGVDVRIEPGCRILGEVLYSGSLDADEGVLFTVSPKKVESLPAESA